LIIKGIKIDKFENIDHFESLFDSKIAVLSDKNADSIIKAIGVALKNSSIISTIRNVSNKTRIEALIELNECTYKIIVKGNGKEKLFSYVVTTNAGPPDIDFYYSIQKSPEEESLVWFSYDKKAPYSERLLIYKDPEKFGFSDDFFKMTNGIGDTRTFRICLHKYIKNYRPENFSKTEKSTVCLQNNGVFCTENGGKPQKSLSQSEKTLFEFVCFLKINELWECVEEIRDINREKQPILITKLVDEIDEFVDLNFYLEKAKKQDRQILISKS